MPDQRIVLTRRELYFNEHRFCDQDRADLGLFESALPDVYVAARRHAVVATAAGKVWPEWVTAVYVLRAELRERHRTRRELFEMATADASGGTYR